MGFSTRAFSHAVKQCVHDRVCQTFGPSGINAGKSIEPAQEADLIGYIVNTQKGTVRPNLKCLHKLFIAFFCTDIRPNVPVSLRDRQVLASLVCRGAQVMRGMSPFVQCFYGWLAGNQSAHDLPPHRFYSQSRCGVLHSLPHSMTIPYSMSPSLLR